MFLCELLNTFFSTSNCAPNPAGWGNIFRNKIFRAPNVINEINYQLNNNNINKHLKIPHWKEFIAKNVTPEFGVQFEKFKNIIIHIEILLGIKILNRIWRSGVYLLFT